LKSSTLQEVYGVRGDRVGKVIWHSLRRDGTITQYDIRFGNKVLKNIPSKLVEAVKEAQHEHVEREERK
jgi:hypothetical protein